MSDHKDVRLQSPLAASSVTTSVATPATKHSEPGAAALTLVLSLLLIDAAVETFLSGAPRRWWVVGIVGAYLGVTGGVLTGSRRGRVGWSQHLDASLFLLLALLVASAWSVDGSNGWVVILRQPPSVILCFASAALLGAGAWSLVGLKLLPLWSRAPLGALSLYGISAFLFGIAEATPYSELFRGDSFWRPLPFWLQGAGLGMFFLLPIQIAGLVLDACIGLRRVPLRRFARRAIASGMALLVAVGGALPRDPFRIGTTAAGARSTEFPVPHVREIADAPSQEAAVVAFYDLLDRASRDVSREAIDVDALVRHLGRNPDAAVDFVSKRVRYEHYDGILRGAEGTLISGSGNSCDQALLLRDLLIKSGSRASVRVISATPELNRTLRLRALVEGVPRVKPRGASPSPLYPVVEAKLAQLERLLGHHESPSSAEPTITTYCWVTGSVSGARREIDTVLGEPPAVSPESTFETTIPSSLRHLFTIRATLERTRRGQTEKVELLKTTVPVDTLEHRPLLFTVRPQTEDAFNQNAQGEIRQGPTQNQLFVPVFITPGQQHVGRAFSLKGAIVEAASAPAIGSSAGGRIAELLHKPLTPEGRTENEDETSLVTGVWMECEITEPNGHVERHRRALFDPSVLSAQTDPALAALQIIQDRHILVTPIRANSDLLTHRLIEYYKQHRSVIESMARGTAPPAIELTKSLPLQLLSLAYLQDRAADEIGLLEDGAALYRGRPSVLIATSDLDIADGRLFDRVRLDVMSTGYEALSERHDERRLRALFGVYTSFLEILAVGGPDPKSVLSLEENARQQGAELIAIKTSQDLERLPFGGSAPQRAALLDELAAAREIVTFNQQLFVSHGPRFGWWRRDSSTGEVLAILDNYEGGVQAGTEYALTKAFVKGFVIGAAYGFLKCKAEHGRAADCTQDMLCKGLFGGALAWVVALAAGLTTFMTIGTDAMGNSIWIWTTQVPSGSGLPVVLGGVFAVSEGLCKAMKGGGTPPHSAPALPPGTPGQAP
jgi:hypothetical protein